MLTLESGEYHKATKRATKILQELSGARQMLWNLFEEQPGAPFSLTWEMVAEQAAVAVATPHHLHYMGSNQQ